MWLKSLCLLGAFFFIQHQSEARNCFLTLVHKMLHSTTRGLVKDSIQLELTKLKAEFPKDRSKKMETIHKRHQTFTKLLKEGRFDSVEKLIAASKHFYGDHHFDLVDKVESLADRITLKENLVVEDFTPDKKGKILLSQEVPKTPEAYQDWLSQLTKSLHHADIHQVVYSVSTNPFARNGVWLSRYKAEVETRIQDKENQYRKFIKRVSRVYPDFKNEFPEKVPDESWLRYSFRSARYLTFLTHPWKELQKRPLTREDNDVRSNHQLYWPRWIAANQAKVGGIVGGTATALFAGYYVSLDEEELEELAKEYTPEFMKFVFNLDTKKMTKEHGNLYEKMKQKRLKEIDQRLKEIKDSGDINLKSPSTLEEIEKLETERKELS